MAKWSKLMESIPPDTANRNELRAILLALKKIEVCFFIIHYDSHALNKEAAFTNVS